MNYSELLDLKQNLDNAKMYLEKGLKVSGSDPFILKALEVIRERLDLVEHSIVDSRG